MIRSGPLAWRFWVGVFSQRRWVVGISVGRGWSPLHLQGVRLWVCGVWPLQMCWAGFMFCEQHDNDAVNYRRLTTLHFTCLSSLDRLNMSFPHYSHFIDEEGETQRGQGTLLMSYSCFKSRLSDSRTNNI